jgi:rhamnosyltransferase
MSSFDPIAADRAPPASAVAQMNSKARPSFAVLLAAFNGTAFLDELLASVNAQQAVSVTLFVSVDLSSDGTEALLQQHAAQHGAGMSLLPTGQRFGSAAANFLRLLRDVDFSGYDYVSLADQDDIWLPDKLQRAHEALTRSDADAYSSNVLAFWPDGRRMLIDKAQPQRPWDFLFEGGGPGCTFVLRKGFALELREFATAHQAGLSAILHHDWLIYAYARAHGRHWIMDSRPGVLYRQHGDNLLGANRGWRAFRSRARAVLHGEGVAQAITLAGVVGLGQHPFVLAMARPGRARFLRLALQARNCRRRWRDQWLFGLACLCLFVLGERG